jgi:very-short-patch-repair endonuclease
MGEGLASRLAVERRILALSRPHGVVHRAQLLAARISRNMIDHRVRVGWLRPLYRGVYAVGPVQSNDAPYLAAVLACGGNAALSHESASFLWRMTPHGPTGPVAVTVPARRCPRHRGIRIHRIHALPPDEVTRLRGIPVTTAPRTLLDLASVLSSRELEQALAQAERMYAGTQRRLLALLARYPARAGTPTLRELLGGSHRPALTRSEAEERFLDVVRRAGLSVPDVNVRFHGYELDFLWREERLAVEMDGFAFHGDRAAFEADRRRDADLAARGIQVMRVTWRQITKEPEATLVRLARALAERARAA